MEALTTSHLIVYVTDTDATLDFWCKGLGGELEQDEELAAPALDAMFGRAGVRIRDTFIRIGGVRLHTIQTLDAPYSGPGPVKRQPGVEGLSFLVPDLEAAHARAEAAGQQPTPIYAFDEIERPVRMFFLDDPDGIRVEMMQYTR